MSRKIRLSMASGGAWSSLASKGFSRVNIWSSGWKLGYIEKQGEYRPVELRGCLYPFKQPMIEIPERWACPLHFDHMLKEEPTIAPKIESNMLIGKFPLWMGVNGSNESPMDLAKHLARDMFSSPPLYTHALKTMMRENLIVRFKDDQRDKIGLKPTFGNFGRNRYMKVSLGDLHIGSIEKDTHYEFGKTYSFHVFRARPDTSGEFVCPLMLGRFAALKEAKEYCRHIFSSVDRALDEFIKVLLAPIDEVLDID